MFNINRHGFYSVLTPQNKSILKKISKKLKIRYKNILNQIVITNLYWITNNNFYVYRFSHNIIGDVFNCDIQINPANNINIPDWEGEFKGNQRIVYDKIMALYNNSEKLKKGKCGLILNLEAGQGKTFVAMGIISKLKVRTLIIVHNTTLLFQWESLLNTYFKCDVGICYGKKKIIGDITIAVINTVIKEINIDGELYTLSRFYSLFDFCILDECHEYCSKQRRTIYSYLFMPYLLGLSATPEERQDGLDGVNIYGIGPVLNAENIPGYEKNKIKFTGEVLCIKYHGPAEYIQNIVNEKTGITSVPLIMNNIVEDPYRLKIIIDEVLKHNNNNHNIFVFADRKSYLDKIYNELEKYKVNSFIMVEQFKITGGCTEDDLKKAEQNSNVILTTYQFMGTGKSIPKMDCIILATPRKNKSRQYINRIFRLDGNSSITRQIVDICDAKTVINNQWYTRKKYYIEKEYIIKEVIIKYNQVVL